MNWYKVVKVAKDVSKEYSWVYVDMPKEFCKDFLRFGEEIDPDDLFINEAENGLEKDPHVTVKYGLLTNEAKDIRDRFKDETGGKVKISESSFFSGDEYDVLKFTVVSKDLERLHTRLNELPHEDSFCDYKPHATIAYLKKGCGKKYDGKFKFNKTFEFSEVFFGDKNRKNHKCKLI